MIKATPAKIERKISPNDQTLVIQHCMLKSNIWGVWCINGQLSTPGAALGTARRAGAGLRHPAAPASGGAASAATGAKRAGRGGCAVDGFRSPSNKGSYGRGDGGGIRGGWFMVEHCDNARGALYFSPDSRSEEQGLIRGYGHK